MNNKEQIIIDGVDVSGCKYLPYCNDKQGNCGFEPGCYFKQLAHKTQECEELKKECKDLKRELTLYKTCYRAKHSDINNLLGSYYKALDEIERYCTDYCDDCFDGYNSIKTYDKCINCFASGIKEIIDKVKGEKDE